MAQDFSGTLDSQGLIRLIGTIKFRWDLVSCQGKHKCEVKPWRHQNALRIMQGIKNVNDIYIFLVELCREEMEFNRSNLGKSNKVVKCRYTN